MSAIVCAHILSSVFLNYFALFSGHNNTVNLECNDQFCVEILDKFVQLVVLLASFHTDAIVRSDIGKKKQTKKTTGLVNSALQVCPWQR